MIKINTIKLIHGDCLDKLKQIKDKSVNLVLIDPPYNISKADWDKWKTIDSYIEFMGQVFKECERVLKDNGSFYFFHNDFEQMAELQHWIKKNTEFELKSLITLNKTKYKKYAWTNRNPEKCPDRNWFPNIEYMLFYTKELKQKSFDTGWEQVKNQNVFSMITDIIKKDIKNSNVSYEDIYNHAFLEGRYKTKESAKVNIRYKLGLSSGHRFDFIDEKLFNHMCNIISFSFEYDWLKQEYKSIKDKLKDTIDRLEGERYTFNLTEVQENISCVWEWNEGNSGKLHPTQKPLDVIEKIIKTSSNEGDLVLDCFMGSCSTGIGCIETGRNFIGIELNNTYFETCKNRVNTYINTNNLQDIHIEIA